MPPRLRLRISIIGVTPRAEPVLCRRLSEVDLEAQLRRRLDALTAAFNNPLAAVRRLQRRLAKHGPARSKLAAAIPGRAILSRLDEAARTADPS